MDRIQLLRKTALSPVLRVLHFSVALLCCCMSRRCSFVSLYLRTRLDKVVCIVLPSNKAGAYGLYLMAVARGL